MIVPHDVFAPGRLALVFRQQIGDTGDWLMRGHVLGGRVLRRPQGIASPLGVNAGRQRESYEDSFHDANCIIAFMNRRELIGALAGASLFRSPAAAQKRPYMQLPEMTAHGELVIERAV